MLSKKYHLSIKERLKTPRSLSLNFLRVVKAKSNLPYLRFAVVVSKKINKKAVVRNRIKRVIYSILEKKLENKKNEDFVLILKQDISKLERFKIEKEIEKIF